MLPMDWQLPATLCIISLPITSPVSGLRNSTQTHSIWGTFPIRTLAGISSVFIFFFAIVFHLSALLRAFVLRVIAHPKAPRNHKGKAGRGSVGRASAPCVFYLSLESSFGTGILACAFAHAVLLSIPSIEPHAKNNSAISFSILERKSYLRLFTASVIR